MLRGVATSLTWAWLGILCVALGCSGLPKLDVDLEVDLGLSGRGGSSAGSGAGGEAGQGGGGADVSGTAGASGQGAAGDSANAGGPADDACLNPGPSPLDPASLPVCPNCEGGARCLPTSLLPEDSRALLGDCDAAQKCVPDLFIETSGAFRLESCRSLHAAEGRCLSVCIPQVAAQLALLPQDSCGEFDRCVPCFDPITGVDTGVCGLACDPGPVEPPSTFAECCGGIGSCLPEALVPEGQRADLPIDSCTGEGQLCAPAAFMEPGGFVLHTCRSLGNAEGRCLPECLPAVAAQADVLPRSSCAAGHLCAPCFDPFTGEPSGVCDLSNDPGPADEDPVVFARCCGALGRCLPTVLIPTSGQSVLGIDTCGVDQGLLCVPEALMDEAFEAPTCASLGGGEGRCLPSCLPSIAEQADQLPQSICDAGHLCAPCFDPFTGTPSGACEIAADPGPEAPPFTFPRCCGGTGVCLEPALVPEEARADLGAADCDDALLCAPEKMIPDDFLPAICASIGGGEGRCLSECLPLIADQADQLERSRCAMNELCAPCHNPLTGEPTGACHLNGDFPQQAPYTFPRCCGTGDAARGTCVPESLVPESQRESLSAQSCLGENVLCAPTDKVLDPEFTFPACSAQAFYFMSLGPGACVPTCFIASSLSSTLTGGPCSSGERCAPCSEGACD